MPERPKRRKNKNKRKNNKNNRSDVNQNTLEGNELNVTESNSDVKENANESNVELKEEIKEQVTTAISMVDTNLETSSSNAVVLCEENDKDSNYIVSPTYIVETPEQKIKTKPKLDNSVKSKSCDNDDTPTIVEITDNLSVDTEPKNDIPVIDSNNVIITEDESHIKWENVDTFKSPQTELIEGVLSSMTIPLNVAHCEQTKILSPEEESSLRNYLHTLNLSTNSTNLDVGDIKTEIEQIINREVKYRLRRKGFTDDIIYPRPGPSRSLAVIDEESGESSKTSRRQSYLSDKKSDSEELEDEVFETKQTQAKRNICTDGKLSSKHLIPQKCIRVDTKLREPEISEARGEWTMQTVEKLAGAELIYLTDSSSSTSSIYEANEDTSPGEDTDVSVRMITPTIEVTDTETLLSNTFLVKNTPERDLQKNVAEISEEKKNKQSFEHTVSADYPVAKENSHEIIVLSTDKLNSNLYVKELGEEDSQSNSNNINCKLEPLKPFKKNPSEIDEYDLEIKVLKCELNDAINNLIKEVTSDSESGSACKKDSLKRQDSSSSVDSSQCTAKYNPTHSSLNDVSNLIQESENLGKEITENCLNDSHVKEVIKCIASKIQDNINDNKKVPFTLREICLKTISGFPFGEKILEELANVSQRLQNSVLATHTTHAQVINQTVMPVKENTQIPPPVYPRKSSLKISQEEPCKAFTSTRTETVYECPSPSQKMLMEKTNTVISREDLVQKDDALVSIPESKNAIQNKFDLTPMKSETGSRLLALLRDTSNSPKLNSKSNTGSENPLPKTKRFVTESLSKRFLDEIDSTEIPFCNNESYKPQNSEPFLKPYSPNRTSSYFYESDSGIIEDTFSKSFPSKRNVISSYSYESDSGIKKNCHHTLRNDKKYFHYSTGNLNKEIESDISSIQNMHRYCINLRDRKYEETIPRRPSLPKDLCEQQMEYIRQKEKEVDAEIQRLEKEKNRTFHTRGPRAPMVSDSDTEDNRIFDLPKRNYVKRNFVPMYPTTANVEKRKISSLFSSSEEELLREKMYSEYVNQMAEREHRKQQKVIKVTQTPIHSNITSRSMPLLDNLNSKINNPIEQEFISKAKERWYKLGIQDPETEDEKENNYNIYREPKVIEHKIKVIESGREKDVKKLPSHMQEFVKFTVNDKDDENSSTGESEKPAHVVVFCAVIILVLTVGKFLLRLFRNY